MFAEAGIVVIDLDFKIFIWIDTPGIGRIIGSKIITAAEDQFRAISFIVYINNPLITINIRLAGIIAARITNINTW